MDKNKESSSLEAQLILENLGLVVAQARRFKPTPISDIDDYKQAGALALLRAIRKYDPSKNASLATFSWRGIYREILREAEKYRKTSSIDSDICEDTKDDISDYIPELSEEQFKILWLRLSGNSLEEIGETLNETKQSINNKLNIIIAIIKKSNEKTKDIISE